MIRRATPPVKKLATRTVKLKLFGGKDNLCAHTFGYRIADGVMEPGLGVYSEVADIPWNVVYARELPSLKYAVFLTSDGDAYRWGRFKYGTPERFNTFEWWDIPFVVDYGKASAGYALFCGDKICDIDAATEVVHSLDYILANGTSHYGRVFAVNNDDKYVIQWSGFDHLNWKEGPDEGGYLRVPNEGGEILGLVSLGTKLIIVREQGVNILNALSDERHFTLSGLIGLGGIYANTAAAYLGKLYVCNEQGLFVLEGDEFKRVGPPKEFNIVEFYDVFVSAKGRMYLSFCDDETGEDTLLEYDARTGAFTRCAVGCHNLFENEYGLYGVCGDKIVMLDAEAEDDTREWTSEQITLGTDRHKLLKRVYSEGEGDFEIFVERDGHSRCVGGLGEAYVGERGKSFSFTVKGWGKFTQLTAEWEVTQ